MLGMAERSAKSYMYRLVGFEDWCGGSAMQATQAQAGAWLMRRAALGDGAYAIYHNRCALVFLFAKMRGMTIERCHLPPLRQPRARQRTIPSPTQISQLFAAMPDPLLRFYCQFLYATGLRRKEALAVRAEDLDLHDGSVLVRCGKGGRTRRSILPASMAGLLAEHRRRWSGRGLLFSADGSGEGKVFQIERIGHALRMARQRCRIELPITAHHLRHAFATHLHERGVGLVELQRLLGHGSILTTIGYIALREERRVDIARFGDLLAALPALAPEQQRIAFAG